MTLSSHIDSDALEERILSSGSKRNLIDKYTKRRTSFNETHRRDSIQSSEFSPDHPVQFNNIVLEDKYKLPAKGKESEFVYNMIHDELILDGKPTLNLASFVNSSVPDDAMKLIMENITKNLADNDEYPMLMEIQQRCISILANLWHAPTAEVGYHSSDNLPLNISKGEKYLKTAIGTPTTGSSEAVMLGGLAMKKTWQKKMKAQGKDYFRPNIIMASCAQVALEKFARYFDVEERIIPCSSNDFLLDVEKVKENCDENTIGVFVIVGSTYTGGFENVERVNAILDEVEEEHGWHIPIHIDGASGAFVAPFVFPEFKWDFRVPRVVSINASGHKFGLVTAGLGWVVWRDQTFLPEELKFQLQYLGGIEESYNLNFSRSGYQVVHQYYNFIRLGRSGYSQLFDECLINARLLSNFLEETGFFTCISNLHLPFGVTTRGSNRRASILESSGLALDDHKSYNPALPVVSFQFTKDFISKYPEIPQSFVSHLLRNRGWIIPNYPLPLTTLSKEELEKSNNEILRVVVRINLSSQLLDKLMHDIVQIVELLVKSVELVRKNVKEADLEEHSLEEVGNDMVYNMLLSIANDANEKIVKMKTAADHKSHHHPSFRGAC